MEPYPLFLDDIRVPDGHRKLNEDAVAGIVKSFKDIGQQMPISYYEDDDGPVLITGLHRLEAARRLDWDTIDGIEMEVDETTRETWKIDENLMRAELTPIERDEHLTRRAELFDAKGGEKIATPGGRQKIGFAKDTADKTGLSKSTINKALARDRKIAPDVKKLVKEIRPDAEVGEIEALASLKTDDQRQAIQDVKSGLARKITDAVENIKLSQEREESNRISEAFDKLFDKAQKEGLDGRVLDHIKSNFNDDIKERIVYLQITTNGLAKLGSLFYEAIGCPDRLWKRPDKIHYVHDALDLVEFEKVTVAKASDTVLAPLREECSEIEKEIESLQAEIAQDKEREWQEAEPFEHFAKCLVSRVDTETLQRHLKNCGLEKLEAAVEKHLAKAETKDAARPRSPGAGS